MAAVGPAGHRKPSACPWHTCFYLLRVGATCCVGGGVHSLHLSPATRDHPGMALPLTTVRANLPQQPSPPWPAANGWEAQPPAPSQRIVALLWMLQRTPTPAPGPQSCQRAPGLPIRQGADKQGLRKTSWDPGCQEWDPHSSHACWEGHGPALLHLCPSPQPPGSGGPFGISPGQRAPLSHSWLLPWGLWVQLTGSACEEARTSLATGSQGLGEAAPGGEGSSHALPSSAPTPCLSALLTPAPEEG